MTNNSESNLGRLEELLRLYYYTCVSGKKKDLFMTKKKEVLDIMNFERPQRKETRYIK